MQVFFVCVYVKCSDLEKNPAQLVAGLVGPDHEMCWIHSKPAQVPPKSGGHLLAPPPNPLPPTGWKAGASQDPAHLRGNNPEQQCAGFN